MISKNKNLFLKIYIPFVIIISIALITLQILGSKKRVGYLTDFNLEIDRTLELNNLNDIRKDFTVDGKLDEENIKNYLLTNENITNYVHHFRIRYYDKVFRNSDIYAVYTDLNNLSDFVKEVKMDYDGSPFGSLISDKIIIGEEKIDNVSYILKLKSSFIKLIIGLNLILIIAFIFKKYFWHNSGFNISKYNEIIIEENNPIYEILLSIPALWIFITSLSVMISEITNKVNYTSYSPYTTYPAIFILLFMVAYLSLYKKINQKTKYIVRLNLIYMLLYFFVYCFKNDIIIYVVASVHILLIILTPLIYKLKLFIEYNFQNKSKYYYLVRNQLIIAFLFIIFYLCFNVGLYLSIVYLIEALVIFLCRDLYKIYNKKIYKIIATVFTILTLIFLVGDNIYNDYWSESNVYLAGINYKKNGFLKYYFLPDFSLPYENTHRVYTHYPPLPDIMFGILYKILPEPKGEIKDNWYWTNGIDFDNLDNWLKNVSPMLWKYRMFPMLWHIIGSFFLWAFFTKISKDKFMPMIAVLLTVSQPALLYCKFNLHYISYASAVLMATPYIIYQFLNTNKKIYGFILLLFGFLQGGLSFDFIIPGTGIALLFLFFPENNKINFNKYALYSFMILVLGSLIAFIAHFIQNSLYFGSVKLAFEDLFGALLHRSVENIHFYNLLIDYLNHTYTSDGTKNLSFNLAFIPILFSYICAIFGYLKAKLYCNKIEIKSDYFKRALFFLLGALAVSSTWVLFMKNHSAIHTFHISRHFIVLFIALMTFLITLFNLFYKEK
ncbi:hypothetical protein [Brachyspira aalborgi]|uniref:hypothetical protein n=1 Tax=Brachyspira aalborgi TaxID=29522 RepID=UPI00266CE8CC|nr:hypothetical protein [Brachyspira aalborgi]